MGDLDKKNYLELSCQTEMVYKLFELNIPFCSFLYWEINSLSLSISLFSVVKSVSP